MTRPADESSREVRSRQGHARAVLQSIVCRRSGAPSAPVSIITAHEGAAPSSACYRGAAAALRHAERALVLRRDRNRVRDQRADRRRAPLGPGGLGHARRPQLCRPVHGFVRVAAGKPLVGARRPVRGDRGVAHARDRFLLLVLRKAGGARARPRRCARDARLRRELEIDLLRQELLGALRSAVAARAHVEPLDRRAVLRRLAARRRVSPSRRRQLDPPRGEGASSFARPRGLLDRRDARPLSSGAHIARVLRNGHTRGRHPRGCCARCRASTNGVAQRLDGEEARHRRHRLRDRSRLRLVDDRR